MAQLAVRAGLPGGLINVVLGDGPTTGTALTGHPEIAKVSFTGSTRAGSAIMDRPPRTGADRIRPKVYALANQALG